MKGLSRKMSFRRPRSRRPSPERVQEEDNADEDVENNSRTHRNSFNLTATGNLKANAIARAYVQDIREAARVAHEANPAQLSAKHLLDPKVRAEAL